MVLYPKCKRQLRAHSQLLTTAQVYQSAHLGSELLFLFSFYTFLLLIFNCPRRWARSKGSKSDFGVYYVCYNVGLKEGISYQLKQGALIICGFLLSTLSLSRPIEKSDCVRFGGKTPPEVKSHVPLS